ncbi:hypothetical protein NM688_g4556 [Phlebia brevispora]|uniref:Uncharacterized protein n=1 Tax=Phlebia brevispora TaxID=194682 RepID=A0ACC1T2T5_9APHY|nr:hypothetical protein NM688_g4556 [Phlebia brevispora]
MSAPTPDAEIIRAYQANLSSNYCTTAASVQRCYNFPLQYFLNVVESLPVIIIAVFSALRVFALLSRAYIPAAFTLALGLAPVVLELYRISKTAPYYVDDPVLGSSCYYNSLISLSVLSHRKNYFHHTVMALTHLTVALASVLSTITADVIAIAITWFKTYRHVREASSIGVNVDVGVALLRYGSLYFIVFFVVNLANGLVELVPSLTSAQPISTFTAVLPSIVLSRFLINLRQVDTAESSSATRVSHVSSLNFRRPSMPTIIGNLGEPLAEDDIDSEDYVIADAYERGSGAAVDSDEKLGMSDVISVSRGGIEEVPV